MKTNLILFFSLFLLFNCNNDDDSQTVETEQEPIYLTKEEYREKILGKWKLNSRAYFWEQPEVFTDSDIVFTFNENNFSVQSNDPFVIEGIFPYRLIDYTDQYVMYNGNPFAEDDRYTILIEYDMSSYYSDLSGWDYENNVKPLRFIYFNEDENIMQYNATNCGFMLVTTNGEPYITEWCDAFFDETFERIE